MARMTAGGTRVRALGLAAALAVTVVVAAALAGVRRGGGSMRWGDGGAGRARERFQADQRLGPDGRDWADPRLRYATKCVDCENAMPRGREWAAQPTKCYSCERQWEPLGLAQHTHPMPFY